MRFVAVNNKVKVGEKGREDKQNNNNETEQKLQVLAKVLFALFAEVAISKLLQTELGRSLISNAMNAQTFNKKSH